MRNDFKFTENSNTPSFSYSKEIINCYISEDKLLGGSTLKRKISSAAGVIGFLKAIKLNSPWRHRSDNIVLRSRLILLLLMG